MKIFRNYILNSSYQLLLIILPLVTAPYIARVLGTKGVGLNTFTASVVAYFVLFATLGTATYGNREIAYRQENKRARSQIFWEITFLSWMTSLVTLVVFLIFLVFIKEYRALYLWQGIAILSTMFDVSWYFVGMEKFKITVTRNFIIKIITVVAIFLFIHKSEDLTLYIIIMMVGGLLGNLSLWPYLREEVYLPNFRKLHFKKHFGYALALFLPTICWSLYVSGTKILVGIFDSVTHAGFYAQSDNLMRLSLSLITSLGIVMLPRISNMRANKDIQGVKRNLVRDFNVIFGISAALSFGMMGCSLNFAPFFFGKSFTMVGTIMMVESPIIFFLAATSIFGTHYFVPMNKMKLYNFSVILGTIINIVLNLIFIPFLGVIAATVIAVITEFIYAATQYIYMQRDFQIEHFFAGLWKYLVAGIGMFAIVFWLNQTLRMSALTLLLQIVVGGLIYVGLNAILQTQLWVIVWDLLSKILSRKKVSVSMEVPVSFYLLSEPIEAFQELFINTDMHLPKRAFATILDQFYGNLKILAEHPIFVKSHAVLLSQQLLDLANLMTEASDRFVTDHKELELFALALEEFAKKVEAFSADDYSLEEISRVLQNEV